jgi:hypothetical protein
MSTNTNFDSEIDNNYESTKSQLLSIRQNTFRFDSQNNFTNSSSHYLTTITVRLIQYEDGGKYYYVSYKHKFIKDPLLSQEENKAIMKKIHPLTSFSHIDSDSYGGDIIFCNEMTDKMIDYLLLDDIELEKVSGVSDAMHYRKMIMGSIGLLWD